MSKHSQFPYLLYLVISERDCKGKDLFAVAKQAILGGVDIIQLREKNSALAPFLKKAMQLKEITDKYNIPLVINDNFQIAKQVKAEGIHVGNSDMPPSLIREQWKEEGKIIGYSIEHLEQLNNEQTLRSDYLGISPIFKTSTKTDTITEWGLQGISQIRALTQKPLVAIGNMNYKNAKAVINAGADCIAVVSEICSAKNPEKAAYQLKNELLK